MSSAGLGAASSQVLPQGNRAVPRAREDCDHSHGAKNRATVKRLPTPPVSGGGRGSAQAQPPVADRSVAALGPRPSGPRRSQKVVRFPPPSRVAVLRSSTRAPTRARPSSRSSTSPSTGSPGPTGAGARSRTSISKRSVPRPWWSGSSIGPEAAGLAQVADRDRAGLETATRGPRCPPRPSRPCGRRRRRPGDGAQQPRLRRDGQADGGRLAAGEVIHGRAATRSGPRSRRRPRCGSGRPWSAW